MSSEIDRELSHLYPAFADKVAQLIEDLRHFLRKHHPEWGAELGEGFRTAARQRALFRKGRRGGRIVDQTQVVTHRDGVRRRSEHQSGLAADIWLLKNGRPNWEETPGAAYKYLGHLARKHGLTWGGAFRNLYDPGHVEWPATDRATYLRARAWLGQMELG